MIKNSGDDCCTKLNNLDLENKGLRFLLISLDSKNKILPTIIFIKDRNETDFKISGNFFKYSFIFSMGDTSHIVNVM